jgi:glucosylceramidase
MWALLGSGLAVQTTSLMAASSFATSENQAMKLSSLPSPEQGSVSSPDWKLFVDDSQGGHRQPISGFGAAWTDAAVACFEALSATLQKQLLDDLFSSDGIHIDFMRHTIGQSDLTPSWEGEWSFDTNNGQPDPNMTHFDLTDPGRKILDWISRMFQVNPSVTLLGSPWSLPQWMKKNNVIQLDSYAGAYALYMVKYLQQYRAAGVKVHAVTLQNEPLHNTDPAWSTYVTSTDSVVLANKLGAAIQSAGLDTEIWAYDHNTDVPQYPDYVLSHAGSFVNTVAWHCYASSVNWTDLTAFARAHPGVKQFMTECWTHIQDENFFELPEFITGPLQNYASGALAWTVGGSSKFDVSWPGGCGQCSGLIQVDRSAGTYEKTQDYYSLGQFSKFVRQGAVALGGSGSYTWPDGTGVQATQYRNPDGSRVVVIVNKIRNDLKQTQVTFATGDVYHGLLPARSVTTWIIPPASSL